MALIMKIATRREGPGSYLDYGASRPLYKGRELIRYIQYGRGCSPRHYPCAKGDGLSREMITIGCDLQTHMSSLGFRQSGQHFSGNLGRQYIPYWEAGGDDVSTLYNLN